MATVHLPRSLVALFPGAPRVCEVDGSDIGAVLLALDARVPGMRDRLVEAGPAIREHINVYVDGEPATISTAVGPTSVVHVIPAVSGGAGPTWSGQGVEGVVALGHRIGADPRSTCRPHRLAEDGPPATIT
jgi:molybdopterin converting factor small subunit